MHLQAFAFIKQFSGDYKAEPHIKRIREERRGIPGKQQEEGSEGMDGEERGNRKGR
jgi:hypothetical protein